MPNDPRDVMTALVHPEGQSDFLRERQRLREARMRWIDEHECPQAMDDLKDKYGNVIYSGASSPFLVGKQTYSDELPHQADPSSPTGYRRPATTFLPEAASKEQQQVADQLREVTKQYNQFSGTMVRDGRGGEIALSHKSDHPPIREGETHEEWFERVSKTYSDAAKSGADAGSAGAGTDHVREASVHDPGDGRPTAAAGAGDSRAAAASGVSGVTEPNSPERSDRSDADPGTSGSAGLADPAGGTSGTSSGTTDGSAEG